MDPSNRNEAIIIDIDGTIADTEVDDFWEFLLKGYNFFVDGEMDAFFGPIADSPRVLNKLADKFKIIYLSSRLSFVGFREDTTLLWLETYGFPKGDLYLRKFMIDSDDIIEFKESLISKLKEKNFTIVAGIGNKVSDAYAYLGNDIRAIILSSSKKLPEGTEKVRSWAEIETLLL